MKHGNKQRKTWVCERALNRWYHVFDEKGDGEEGHDVDNHHVGAVGNTANFRLPGICNDVCIVLGEFVSISCFDQNILNIIFGSFPFGAESTTECMCFF